MMPRKNIKLLQFSIYFLIILSILGCSKKPLNANTKITIAQWGQEKYLIYLPLYVAIEKGFFSENGIEANVIYSGNDDQVFASVLQGGAQFGIGDPVFTAIANERRKNTGKVVASIVDGVAIWGVTNKNNISLIDEKRGLKNLRIGTFPSPSTNYTLMKDTIISGGTEMGTAKIIEAPIGGQIALLEKDIADIAMVLEPAASKAENEGYRVVFSSPHFYGPFAFTGLTTSDAYLAKNPEVVQKVVNAIHKAHLYCHSNPDGAIDIAKKLFPDLKSEIIENAVKRMLEEKTIPITSLVTRNSWEAAIKVRLDVGDIKKQQGYLEAVDPTFAQKAESNYKK